MLLSQAAARSPCGPHANRVYGLPEGTYKLMRYHSLSTCHNVAHWAAMLAVTSKHRTRPHTRAFGIVVDPEETCDQQVSGRMLPWGRGQSQAGWLGE